MSQDTKELAREKVEKALALIEQAQRLLGAACEELCPLLHASKQWKMVGDHYDKTKALWYRVNETIPRSKVDVEDYYLKSLSSKQD